MAVGVLFDGVGMSQDQYNQVSNAVTNNDNNDTGPSEGILTHVAGPTEDGFCVIETWASREAFETFYATKLRAALEAAQVQGRPKIFDIVNSMP